MRRVLLLAGTAEARELAALLAERDDVEAVASLAGVTKRPEEYAGRVRVGGFGGAEGLAGYLRRERIEALIDATHPFAEQISVNAAAAARTAEVPCVRLDRPPWTQGPGDAWRHAATLDQAAAALPAGARVFLATGSGSFDAFAHRSDVWLLSRATDPPEREPFAAGEVIVRRPPYLLADEIALFRDRAITHVVAKNAGGPARAKLDAARELGLAVIVVARPAPEPDAPPQVATVEAALAWLDATLEETRR